MGWVEYVHRPLTTVESEGADWGLATQPDIVDAMRVNFALVGVAALAFGAVQAVAHHYWDAGFFVVVAVVVFVMHPFRVRRFKRFDDAKKFD